MVFLPYADFCRESVTYLWRPSKSAIAKNPGNHDICMATSVQILPMYGMSVTVCHRSRRCHNESTALLVCSIV
jgi:hypothetical protein